MTDSIRVPLGDLRALAEKATGTEWAFSHEVQGEAPAVVLHAGELTALLDALDAATARALAAEEALARLDLTDELLNADHETAAFLHEFMWSAPHITEPTDGDDCNECYADAERLRSAILAANRTASGDEG